VATAVQHLNIDYAVEGTDLPFRNSNPPDSRSIRNDFNRQIGSVNGVELPIAEFAVELAVNEGSDV
jgi:hypothetical protein